MRIITACNDKYFPHLLGLVTSIHNYLAIPVDVANLGMTEVQKDALGMMGVIVFPPPAYPAPGKGYPTTYKPRALWKPPLLEKACGLFSDDILYMDADTRVINSFDFPTSKIGVTQVPSRVMRSFANTPMIDYVGPYHSGVLFLPASSQRREFLDAWVSDLRSDPLPSDKKSMNRVLLDFDYDVLDEDEFNTRTMYPFTKIFHYQGPIVR